MLAVELSPEAENLAGELDKRGLKPKGVFKFTDKYLHDRESASYMEAATRTMSARSKPKHSSGAKGSFDEQQQHVAVVEFDFDAVDALLDGGEALEVAPGNSPKLGEADLRTLQSWRAHFSIPKPQLPTNIAEMSANKRREWFRIARQRIESLWPSKDYYDEI